MKHEPLSQQKERRIVGLVGWRRQGPEKRYHIENGVLKSVKERGRGETENVMPARILHGYNLNLE